MKTNVAVATSKLSIYKAFSSLSLPWKVAVSFGVAALVGVLAQIRIPLPFTPVPITLQVFGVIAAGLFLGSIWGAISMLIYATIGAMGMPWFTGFSGGIHHILGPTGGYIIGFIVASYIAGTLANRGRYFSLIGSIAGIITIYLFGMAGLMAYGMNVYQAFYAGVAPFIAVDIIKGIFAGGTAEVLR